MNERRVAQGLAAALAVTLAAGNACAQSTVTMWVHAGPGPEADAYVAAVEVFNKKNADVKVELIKLPEGSYSDQVNAAALARKLPCVLDFDGPNVYNYAWTKKIIPLDGFPELAAARADMLPSLVRQGSYGGQLYTMGQFDSGLALWVNRKLLERAGVRIPAKVSEAWTYAEFETALKKLKASGVAYPLDMKFNYGAGEWFTYGFSPLVQSFGGDLIERNGFKTASGVINGDGAVRALSMLQNWVRSGYVNAATKDDADFVKGKSAISYVGHWTYKTYKAALGDDLVLVPMPRFGSRAVTGAGSWNFGISAHCKDPKAAARVLAHLMSPAEVLRVTEANGAVPGTQTALAQSKEFGPGGALRIYAEQIREGIALVRPQTPAYPVITLAFSEAVNNIIAGGIVKKELDRAAKKIDRAIEDNRGYPVK
ncbi:ABC transporter substrate-binding protein [Piscinibacter sp.]|uniref:ABC transporter substrate-binding protein n=1 Tax=Piscinibacter sp. TaxID=1903157 RepID=UPI002B85F090|nr:sugar ABC transporter substrate-binding protein [Albitalea sp.]HUG25227.1 sugar ABC transporter substrate-binding protein [Albitalea sp.]